MKGYRGARAAISSRSFDRPALQALPAERFVHADWLQARVNIDYHVEVDRHYYSVPYPLVHETLDVRLSATTVEIFQRGTRDLGPISAAITRPAHHGGRAHAEGASRASGMEPVAPSCAAAATIARRPRRSCSRFSTVVRIPSRAIDPVSDRCAWPETLTARPG